MASQTPFHVVHHPDGGEPYRLASFRYEWDAVQFVDTLVDKPKSDIREMKVLHGSNTVHTRGWAVEE